MSMGKIARLVIKAKPDKAIKKAEDPQEALDDSYRRQLEMLVRVRRGLADVVESRKLLEAQMNTLRQKQEEAADQARLDGDHQARHQKAAVDNKLSDLTAQHAALGADEEKLAAACQRLGAKVEAFKVQKEIIKATYAAAEAQSRFAEIWSSISEEMGNEGFAEIPDQRQREVLTQLSASINQVSVSRKHIDWQINVLRQHQAELEEQARQAFGSGREDLARQAFAQNAEIEGQLPELVAQSQSLQADEDKLTAGYEWLAAGADRLRAQNNTATTTTRLPGGMSEAASGVSGRSDAHDTEA